ncbi:MAG TPA: hypothetical protein PKW60_14900, partial [Candidatus Hydrogenedentes bacterium]|nr:hypothetical protein [Candidatus Hydrogenedentota bacterium]
RIRLRMAALYALPMAFVAAGFMALRLMRMSAESTLFALDVTPGHALTVIRLATRYLLFPFHLSLRELVREHPWGALAAFAVAAGACWSLRRRAYAMPVAAGAAWTVVTAALLLRTMSPWTLYLPSAGFCLALAGFAPAGCSRRECVPAAVMITLLFAYTLQLEARKEAWWEADRVTRTCIDDFRHAVLDEERGDPILVCAPGAVADIPTLLHYFDMRMRLETGRQDLDPLVLAFVMLPAEPQNTEILVKKEDAGMWRVQPADPGTTFLFPQKGYEFQQYPANTAIKMPWGKATLRGANIAGEPTGLDIQVAPEAYVAWQGRKWYTFDGKHLVALPAQIAP